MRITSQDEKIDVSYDMCSLQVLEQNGAWTIDATVGVDDWFTLGTFPTETAAKRELTRIWESWDRGCSNHQIRKAESYEL